MLRFKAAVGHGTRLIAALGVCLLLTASPLLPPKPAAAAGPYYVAPNGSDTNGAGTLASPWQTIQYASSRLSPGDTVYIRAGTYHEAVWPTTKGTPGNYITYAAYPGETPTLDGTGINLGDNLVGLFEIDGLSYIRVTGLHIINAGPNIDNAGLLVDDDSSYITVEGVSTYNTASSGIGIWNSHHVQVDGNRIEKAGLLGYQECLTVADSDNFTVFNNDVLNCHKEGICAKESHTGQIYGNRVSNTDAVGIYVDASMAGEDGIAVFQNVVHDSATNGIALASEVGGLLDNVQVYNNVAYHNHNHGVLLSACCSETSAHHPLQDIRVVNNTLYDNGVTWGGGIAIDNSEIETVTVRDNIVSQNNTFQMAVAVMTPTLTIDYNLIDGYRGDDADGETRGTDYVEGSPLFYNSATADFHSQEQSPAIDAGVPDGAPAVDFDGRTRPLDGNCDRKAEFDIGAFEMPCFSVRLVLPLCAR